MARLSDERLRAAVCGSRGGWAGQPAHALRALWDRLDAKVRKRYLMRLDRSVKAEAGDAVEADNGSESVREGGEGAD